MKIVVTAATAMEILPEATKLKKQYTNGKAKVSVSFVETGVGMLSTAICLMQIINVSKPDLIIQIGIAGGFDRQISLTKVVAVSSEVIADLGVQQNNMWYDVFDLKLQKANKFPFNKKAIVNKNIGKYNLLNFPAVQAISVNEISTQANKIDQFLKKYKPVIETMEGVALHQVCTITKTPFLQLRSISNYVGERDKSKWKIKQSVQAVNTAALQVISKINKQYTK